MSTGHIRILSVDDHQLIREGLAALINDEPDMTLVAEATDGGKAIRAFRAHRPDVTLMDLRLPDMSGIQDLLEAIRHAHAGKKTVPWEVGARLVDGLHEDPLTPREISVLQEVAAGARNRQIGVRSPLRKRRSRSI